MEFKRETRTFDFELTDVEKGMRARAATTQLVEAAKTEDERLAKVGEATDLRKTVKGLQAKALEHSRVVAAGKEPRQQACEWRPHPERPAMQLFRLDFPADAAGAIVDERPMTKTEEREYSRKPVEEPPASADGGQPHAEDKGAKASGPVECCAVLARNDGRPATEDQLCGKSASRRAKGLCPDHKGADGKTVLGWIQRRKERQKLLAEAAGANGNGHAADAGPDVSGEPDALAGDVVVPNEPPAGVEATQ